MGIKHIGYSCPKCHSSTYQGIEDDVSISWKCYREECGFSEEEFFKINSRQYCNIDDLRRILVEIYNVLSFDWDTAPDWLKKDAVEAARKLAEEGLK